jgi:gamma-glutamyltranspeptidase/glutathione hydrolase
MVPTQNWEVRKPGAVSARGLVAAQNGAAAEIGAEILAAGGSAVDAVIATAFALAVLEPWNSGLGGIGFMVVHPAGAAQAETIDFGPVAPQGLDPAAYPLTGATHTQLFTWPQVKDDRNVHGPLSFTIPSAVRGYAAAAARFGRLPWRDLVLPAAALARVGLPVDWYTTLKVATAAVDLRRYDESRRIWLPDGLPPVAPPEEDRFFLPLGRLAAWPRPAPRTFIRARSRPRSLLISAPRAASCRWPISPIAGRALCRRCRSLIVGPVLPRPPA